MSDLERLLRSSLEDVGNRYEPADEAVARERFLRRKRGRRFRFAVSGVAVAAAAVAAALFVFSVPATEEETPLPSAAAPQPVATIAVGDEPISTSAGDAGVWIAEAGAESVTLIDPNTNEVRASVPVGRGAQGAPDEVDAHPEGDVWIVTDAGWVTRLYGDPPGGAGNSHSSTSRLVARDDVHLDIAATPTGMVAVDPTSGELYLVSEDGEGPRNLAEDNETSEEAWSPTDVAHAADRTWLLDGSSGEVRELSDPTGESVGPSTYRVDLPVGNAIPSSRVVGGGDNADLAATDDSLWIANGTGGSLFRIDLTSGNVDVEHEVGGRYTDLTVEGNTVWALTGGDGPSMLRQFDAASGRVVGDPLEMSGRPTDVTAADGSAWVTEGDGANVVRVDPSPVTDEDAAEDEAGALIDLDDLVFAYSERGDLYVQPHSGEPIRLTDTPRKSEVNPTISPEGDALVYEVTPGSLERLDLVSGESRDLGEGSNPSFGPDGTLAWVVNNAADGTEIHVGPAGGEPTLSVSAEDCSAEADGPPDPAQMCPMIVRNLSWAPDGSALYYEAGWEFGFALYQLQMDEGSQPFDLGEATGYEIGGDLLSYEAPTNVANDSVYVVRSCCTKGPDQEPTSHEFGRISFTEGGPGYEELFDLGRIDPAASDWQSVSLGSWTLREDGTWEESDESTWLISDSTVLWLVDDTGETTEVRDPGPGPGGILSAFEGLAARR